MRKILIMTLGTTNPKNIAPSYQILFSEYEFDEVIIIRSDNENSIAQEKIIRQLNENKMINTFVLNNPENIQVIYSNLTFQEKSLYRYLKQKDMKNDFYLDITGGTKIMSAATLSVLSNFKNLKYLLYITGERSRETGKAIGGFRVEKVSYYNAKFFLNFPLDFFEKKDFIRLSSFLKEYRNFFTHDSWRFFILLVDFYKDFFQGKFELLLGNKFIKKSYDEEILKKVILNKESFERFLNDLKRYLHIRFLEKNLTEKDRYFRIFFEVGYFYDRLLFNFENEKYLETLGYFYIFFEKLVNLVLFKNLKNKDYEFVFDKNTFFLKSKLDETKILGVKEKIDLIENQGLKDFFNRYMDKVIKKRNISIIGHGEVYPDEKVLKEVGFFIKELESSFSSLIEKCQVLTYPDLNFKNIFFS